MDKVIAWISASKDDCRKPYSEVIEELRLEVSPLTLGLSLKKGVILDMKLSKSHQRLKSSTLDTYRRTSETSSESHQEI